MIMAAECCDGGQAAALAGFCDYKGTARKKKGNGPHLVVLLDSRYHVALACLVRYTTYRMNSIIIKIEDLS